MNFLTSILRKKDEPVQSYADFWNWFQKHEGTFHKVVKEEGNIEKAFLDKLSPKLSELKEGFFYLTGMYDDHTVELVLTADGTVKNLVFVEELVEVAPEINGWRFTALNPALPIEDVGIRMADYTFSSETMWFYPNVHSEYPDEIDVTIVHDALDETNKDMITNGIYIFLDNYLGELESATMIDNLIVTGKAEPQEELIPISKL